jgi:DNA-3-methyladenine glycosylase II
MEVAIAHLRASDPVMARVIGAVGPYTLKPSRHGFRMLVRSILSQQISMGAARSIRRRLEKHLGTTRFTAAMLAPLTPAELRTLGVSPQKAAYLLDLARKSVDGQIQFRRFHRLKDEEIIAELTQIKGIGRWTAQMFLIFSAGRVDVFPHEDLGVRTAIRNLYGLRDLPDRETSDRIAERWRPYCSVASWYCWRSLELDRRVNGRKTKVSSK